MRLSNSIGDAHHDRAYAQTRSRLPCVAADWTPGSDRAVAAVSIVFGVVSVLTALTWVVL
jgi:hypothetical protein